MDDYWFPWSPRRYRADTMHLNDEQDLIYRRLIDFYMETKLGLPDNDGALANIARVSAERFAACAVVIREFFRKDAKGRLRQKHCDEILADQGERNTTFRNRARKAADARWNKNKKAKASGDFLDDADPVDNSVNPGDNFDDGDEKNVKHMLSSTSIDPLASGSMSQASASIAGNDDESTTKMLEPCSKDAQAMLADATGQDSTVQDKTVRADSSLPISKNLKNPLTPESGDFKKAEGGKAGNRFSLRDWLDANPEAEHRVMAALLNRAPGWDRQFLVKEYDRTADKRKGTPGAPESAFLGWIEKFYSGKKP